MILIFSKCLYNSALGIAADTSLAPNASRRMSGKPGPEAMPTSNQVFQFGTIRAFNWCKKRYSSGKKEIKIIKKQSFLGKIWLKNAVFGAKMGVKTA
jgi:hypothetical protein